MRVTTVMKMMASLILLVIDLCMCWLMLVCMCMCNLCACFPTSALGQQLGL